MLAGYPHFVKLARRLQWDAAAIDLAADARAWPEVDPRTRGPLLTLIAGFAVGEARVADELAPFAARAEDPDMRAAFEAQTRDEERHAVFFDRVAAEVAGIPGDTPDDRRLGLREMLGERYVELFERRLPEVARELALGGTSLAEAVGLYHMVLEGVIFSAGQVALLELLGGDAPLPLPGLRRGVELVTRDERWHVGLGTRALLDAGLTGAAAMRVLAEGEAAADVWADVTDDATVDRARAIHRRRLATIGIHAPDAARV